MEPLIEKPAVDAPIAAAAVRAVGPSGSRPDLPTDRRAPSSAAALEPAGAGRVHYRERLQLLLRRSVPATRRHPPRQRRVAASAALGTAGPPARSPSARSRRLHAEPGSSRVRARWATLPGGRTPLAGPARPDQPQPASMPAGKSDAHLQHHFAPLGGRHRATGVAPAAAQPSRTSSPRSRMPISRARQLRLSPAATPSPRCALRRSCRRSQLSGEFMRGRQTMATLRCLPASAWPCSALLFADGVAD